MNGNSIYGVDQLRYSDIPRNQTILTFTGFLVTNGAMGMMRHNVVLIETIDEK